MTFKSSSLRRTKEIAALLAREIRKSRKTGGAFVVALVGNLGSGKTAFVQGFAHGFGLKRRITSPTFLVLRSYGRLHHIDAYRIRNLNELEVIGLKDIFEDPRNVVLVEWADRIKKVLPKDSLVVRFRHGRKLNERMISFGKIR
ncbi:MAG TPA: tRNA (adenosine(37)-N6)-threonylcarbamoyltransferase complex ATPase subunit type 1 TsaE [Candidatus Paceibacterota bacterium]|nr:tRNA (adenosine(37)-N6)-threonylcarbamoyltransferase complex ATPase subunit type 1 TsaE [Candidatus Paceibacterota bacterium]